MLCSGRDHSPIFPSHDSRLSLLLILAPASIVALLSIALIFPSALDMPLLPLVQNGAIVFPERSYSSRNVVYDLRHVTEPYGESEEDSIVSGYIL